MFDTTLQIVRNENILGFYRGVQSPLLGLIAINCVFYSSYGQGKNFSLQR